MSNRPKEGARIRAALVGEQPTDTERFLDNFGTMLQVIFVGDQSHKRESMRVLQRLMGPDNTERMLEEYRKACVEFFGHEHECFRDTP